MNHVILSAPICLSVYLYVCVTVCVSVCLSVCITVMFISGLGVIPTTIIITGHMFPPVSPAVSQSRTQTLMK